MTSGRSADSRTFRACRHPAASPAPSAKDVEDRWVQIGILEGEPIVDRKLAAQGSPPGLVARIPKGMRAFAIEVNEQTGVSGFVLPDHRVDVVQIEPGANGQPEAETVLQDVLVLASGQVFTRPDDRSIQARTVTLAVTPEQVDTLVSAGSQGPLTLALRGLNDHAQSRAEGEAGQGGEGRAEGEAGRRPRPSRSRAGRRRHRPSPPPAPRPGPGPAAAPRPRFVTIYRGLDNMRRVRLDQPADVETSGRRRAAP